MGNHGSKSKTKSNSKASSSSKSSNNHAATTKHVTTNTDDEKKLESETQSPDPTPLHKQSSAKLAGLAIIEKGFVKIDHFENIYRIDPKVDGAPNFRQSQGFYIFGGGQPTINAHKLLFKTFQELGLTSVLWFNMRSEPVIYVNNMSYAPGDPKRPSENIHLPHDLTSEDISNLTHALAKAVRKNAEANKNVFIYHKNTYALLPQDRIDQTKQEALNFDEYTKPVKPLMDLYDTYLPQWLATQQPQQQTDNNFPIHCERLPVNDERAPDAKDIDRLVSLIILHSNKTTALVFNCQMGKGRTTEGMIMAGLLKKNMKEYYEDLDAIMNKCMNNNIFWPINKPLISAEASKDDKAFNEMGAIKEIILKCGETYYNGNYTIITNLVNILTNVYKLNGKLIKQETDDIIDRCQHLQNLRRCIFSTKLRYEHEIAEAKQNDNPGTNRSDYWKKLSLNYVERYFVLICFNAYLHDVIGNGGIDQLSKVQYSKWIQEKDDIGKTLGSYTEGPLAKFNWD